MRRRYERKPVHRSRHHRLSAGTGRFAGLSGTVAFHQAAAGALYSGTLKGTLAG
jgi:hypothetical protein